MRTGAIALLVIGLASAQVGFFCATAVAHVCVCVCVCVCM